MRDAKYQLIAGYKTLGLAVLAVVVVLAGAKILALLQLDLGIGPGVGVALLLVLVALLIRGAVFLTLGSTRLLRTPSTEEPAPRALSLVVAFGSVVVAGSALWMVWRLLRP